MRDSLETGTVAPNQRIQIRQFKKIFSNLTSTEILTFQDKNGKEIQRPFTFINNQDEFKSSIASMRQKDVSCLTTKFGLDNGQVSQIEKKEEIRFHKVVYYTIFYPPPSNILKF